MKASRLLATWAGVGAAWAVGLAGCDPSCWPRGAAWPGQCEEDDDTTAGDDDTTSGDDDATAGDDDTTPGDDDTAPCGTAADVAWGMVFVPPGTFTMGSPLGETGHGNDEVQHTVILTHDFCIGEHEVTQAEFASVMGAWDNLHDGCGECPVEMVSWNDAAAFANAVSVAAGLDPCFTGLGTTDANGAEAFDTVVDPYTCTGYRLPTESEWEYAARSAGTTFGAYPGGADLVEKGDLFECAAAELTDGTHLGAQAWYCYNASETREVKLKLPNPLGLYDMAGNVWELCWDWYGDYPTQAESDWPGAESGDARVFRGGSWVDSAAGMRVAFRGANEPSNRFDFLGLRLSRSLP